MATSPLSVTRPFEEEIDPTTGLPFRSFGGFDAPNQIPTDVQPAPARTGSISAGSLFGRSLGSLEGVLNPSEAAAFNSGFFNPSAFATREQGQVVPTAGADQTTVLAQAALPFDPRQELGVSAFGGQSGGATGPIVIPPEGPTGPTFDPALVTDIINQILALPDTPENAIIKAQIAQALLDGNIQDAINLANQAIATTAAGGQVGAAEAAAAGGVEQAQIQAGATTEAAGIQAQGAVDAAQINATASTEIANITGISNQEIAQIQANASLEVADRNNVTLIELETIRAASDRELAELDNESRQEVERIKGEFDIEVARQTGLDAATVAGINATAATQVAEINAQTQLFALLSNPSAIGVLTGFGQLPVGAGGGEGGLFDTVPTISGLRNASDEQLRFLEGGFSTQGVTPSALANLVRSVSPVGAAPGVSRLTPVGSRSGVV